MTGCTCVEDVVCGACMTGGAATPTTDDVREATCIADKIRELDEAERTARDFSTNSLPRWATALILASRDLLDALTPSTPPDFEVRPSGTVTPTPEEWAEQMDAERVRQIEHGYDDAHDAEHGAAHLLNWSIDYARRGNSIAAATMARCALRLRRGTVTDAEVEAGAIAIFAQEQCDRHQKSTPQLLRENWAGRLSARDQDEYRSLSRAALEAARLS